MKTIYFTVDKELNEIDSGLFDTTGNKTITVYTIENNEPKIFFEIESILENNSIEEIQWWLDENGYGDEEFNIQDL